MQEMIMKMFHKALTSWVNIFRTMLFVCEEPEYYLNQIYSCSANEHLLHESTFLNTRRNRLTLKKKYF